MNKGSTKILGVSVDNLSREEIDNLLDAASKKESANYFIATVNPEILLQGQKDQKYKNILNSADLRLCDGFGIKLAIMIKGRKMVTRYTGVDILDFMFKKAKIWGLKVLVITGKNSLSTPQEIIAAAQKRYGLKIEAKYNENDIFEGEELKSAQIIFVNFGAPEQERMIFENRDKFSAARVLVGIGGAFDFLTGKIKRAPLWLQKAGMEWSWRFLQEPKRIKRIFSAVAIFPLRVMIMKEE